MGVRLSHRCAAVSDIGLRRMLNQDAYLLNAVLGFFAVADGMGGPPGGDVASRLAVTSLCDYMTEHPGLPADDSLRGGFRKAQQVILGEAERMPELREMGTTLVAARIAVNEISVAHIGDSRAYLFREGKLLPLTEDHSVVNDGIRMGMLSREAARLDPRRHILTRALGSDAPAEPSLAHAVMEPGDRLLLCTDGLTGMIDDSVIAGCLSRREPPIDCCRRLVEAALDAGGSDNITVVLVDSGS